MVQRVTKKEKIQIPEIVVNDVEMESDQDEDDVTRETIGIEPDLLDESPIDSVVTNAVIENKETKIRTSEYSSHEFSEIEIAAAQSLHESFTTFLTKTADISPEMSVRNTLPTGIDLLDVVLGGGVATKLSQFVGDPGTGKSAMVSRILATGQRKWPGKFISIYIDSEQSMSSERLEQLGVKYPIIKPYSDDVTVERIFKTIESICVFKTEHEEYMNIPSCVIWDSIANTLTDKGMVACLLYTSPSPRD